MIPSNGRLKTLTTDELKAEFREAVDMTAEGIRYMAVVWCELVDRGVDMSGYANPLTALFPLVESMRLHPEIVVKFGAHTALCEAASELVAEDQAKLLDDDFRIRLLTPDGGIKAIRPLGMNERQIKQVFGDGRIRSPAEQRPHMPAQVKPSQRESIDYVNLDLADVLTPKQIAELRAAAIRQKISVVQMVARVLVSHKIISDAPAVKVA